MDWVRASFVLITQETIQLKLEDLVIEVFLCIAIFIYMEELV